MPSTTAWSPRASSFGRPGRANHSSGSRVDHEDLVQVVLERHSCVTHVLGKRAAISAEAEIVEQTRLARMDSRTARSAELRCIYTNVPHRPVEQQVFQPQIGRPDAAARGVRATRSKHATTAAPPAKAACGNSDPSVLRSRPCALVADELRRLPRGQCRTRRVGGNTLTGPTR